MKLIYSIFIIVLLMFVGCESDTITGMQGDDASNTPLEKMASHKVIKMVPMKGIFSGSGSFDLARTDCPEGSRAIYGEGYGNASHIGNIHVTYSHCTYALDDPNNPTYVGGRATMVAPNGDEIHGSYEGMLTGPNTFIDYNTIKGGTGRFENATGSFTEYGTVFFTDEGFDYEITFKGMISSVGSSK